MFGFLDLGALIVRKSAAQVVGKRKYFGGGTTKIMTCTRQPWVERKKADLHESLEDGIGAVQSILALQCAIRTHKQWFGGFEEVSRHTGRWARCYTNSILMRGCATLMRRGGKVQVYATHLHTQLA
jgi:molybdenum cofactor sulfurtransferase